MSRGVVVESLMDGVLPAVWEEDILRSPGGDGGARARRVEVENRGGELGRLAGGFIDDDVAGAVRRRSAASEDDATAASVDTSRHSHQISSGRAISIEVADVVVYDGHPL